MSIIKQAGRKVIGTYRSAVHGGRTARRLRGKRDLRLNVGCGLNGLDGWVNLDVRFGPRISYHNLEKGLPVDDGAAVAIFGEHFFEHVPYKDAALGFLKECRRALCPGGVIRLVVPDAELYIRLYAQGGWEELAKVRPLIEADGAYSDRWLGAPYRTRMELINAVFRQGDEHKFAYDAETLIALLEDAGFTDVARTQFGISRDPGMAPDSPERRSESLYVEGSAPSA